MHQGTGSALNGSSTHSLHLVGPRLDLLQAWSHDGDPRPADVQLFLRLVGRSQVSTREGGTTL